MNKTKTWMVSTLLVLFFTLITFSGLNVWAASTQPITKTSTTTQKVRQKLKKRSTKTYTTKTRGKKSTRISRNSKKTVTTTTTVSYKYKYKKGTRYRIKIIVTKKTTVTVYNSASSSSGNASKSYITDLPASVQAKIGYVAVAFQALNFKVKVDTSINNYAGRCNIAKQLITLRKEEYLTNHVIYHELGHFVGFMAGNVDRNNEFLAIYNGEKDNYTKLNKPYVCQNSSEFFAECYGLYITDPAYLKKNLPYSYNYIIQSIRKIDKTRVAKVKEAYAPYWKY